MQSGDSQRHTDEEVVRLRAALAAAERRANWLREEVRAAERAKDEFLANISHEVRTPMNAILGFCRMLLRDPLEPSQTEKLEYIHGAAECLLQHINNALDYSRLSAGELKLTKAPLELDAVIHDVMAAMRDPARLKGLAIDYQVENAVPRWLLGDARWLGQVLDILARNALKFTERGEIHVRVSLDERQGDLAVIRLVVTDTGVGIAPDRQQVIFNAFAQADGTSTRRFGGLGLGLSICKQLVDLMDGQIGFRSRPGSGSSFWVTVPLQVCVEPRGTQPTGQEVPAHRTGRFGRPLDRISEDSRDRQPSRVLMADHDYLNRTLVEMLLGRAGCLIDTALNGQDAVAMASQTRYDLVLIDVQLPDVDALAAIRQLREPSNGPSHAAAIVAFATETCPDHRQQCLASGADEYLVKPITPDSLLAVVEQLLPGCLETEQEPASCRPTESQPSPPHVLRRHVETIGQALSDGDLNRLETAAGLLKTDLLRADARPIADQAMRVQFAARGGDPDEAACAVERLRDLLATALVEPTRIPQMTGDRP